MKKRNITLIVIGAFCVFNINTIFAQSFEGRENEMNQKCAVISDTSIQAECREYKEYLQGKSSNLDKEIGDIQGKLAGVKGDMEKIGALIRQNNEQIDNYEIQISGIQATIDQSQASIDSLNAKIVIKTDEVKLRDEQMKERIVEMQVYIGSNNYIDFMMGSSDFADLMRRTQIVGELNQYENDQIAMIDKEKKKLSSDKQLVIEQKELLELQIQNVNISKEKVLAINSINQTLFADYNTQAAILENQKRTAQMAQANIPTIDLSIADSFDKPNENPDVDNGSENPGGDGGTTPPPIPPVTSTTFIVPLQYGWHYESGTWAYPGGGGHMGMDFSTMQVTGIPVVAPADGIIIYTSNSGCDNNGYSTCGIPWGCGNNTLLLTKKGDTIYAMPFYHLTTATKSAGTKVAQGELIGYSGNSGNSTGPHTHVEVIQVGNMSMSDALSIYNRTGDLTFGTGWNANSPKVCGLAPCRERPENYWQ